MKEKLNDVQSELLPIELFLWLHNQPVVFTFELLVNKCQIENTTTSPWFALTGCMFIRVAGKREYLELQKLVGQNLEKKERKPHMD